MLQLARAVHFHVTCRISIRRAQTLEEAVSHGKAWEHDTRKVMVGRRALTGNAKVAETGGTFERWSPSRPQHSTRGEIAGRMSDG